MRKPTSDDAGAEVRPLTVEEVLVGPAAVLVPVSAARGIALGDGVLEPLAAVDVPEQAASTPVPRAVTLRTHATRANKERRLWR